MWSHGFRCSFKKPRVDVRKIKQLERQEERQQLRQLENRILAEKSLVERVRLKLQFKSEVLNEVKTAGLKLHIEKNVNGA
jgi:hypothetical protein